jgi:YVTN family beta-propeller protein
VGANNIAYISQLDAGTLAAATLPALSLSGSVPVGNTPTEVAFNSSGTKAYVTNQFSQDVGVIDVGSNSQTATVPVSGNPFALIVAPGDSVVYVTTTADSLFGIATATNTITHRLWLPIISNGMAIRDSLLYVSTRDAGIVSEINTRSNTVLRVFPVGGAPQGVVLSPSKTELYIANQDSTLQFWSIPANASLGTARIAGRGFGLAQSPATQLLFVTTLEGGEVQVFSPVTRAQVDSFMIGGVVRRIAFNASGTVAVVANEDGWVDFLH